MSKRKTVNIKDLVKRANAMIAATPDEWVGERQGIAAVIDVVLHDCGRYAGFSYLASELNEDGSLIDGYDDSRRRYYIREV